MNILTMIKNNKIKSFIAIEDMTEFMNNNSEAIPGSIVVSIPACHAGDRGSIPRLGG